MTMLTTARTDSAMTCAPIAAQSDGLTGIRTQLQTERDRLAGFLRTLVREVGLFDQTEAAHERERDSLDWTASGRTAIMAIIDLTRSALDEVDAALARLDCGTYGICEGCQDSIPIERLGVLPASRFCTSCQCRREQPSSLLWR
jgi:DnaK suppressor protein